MENFRPKNEEFFFPFSTSSWLHPMEMLMENYRSVVSVVLDPRIVFTGWCFLFFVVGLLDLAEMFEHQKKADNDAVDDEKKRKMKAMTSDAARRDAIGEGRTQFAETCVVVATLSRFSGTPYWSVDWTQWPTTELILFGLLVALLLGCKRAHNYSTKCRLKRNIS